MFGIGMTEMIVIAVIALIFIGPDQIPDVARTVGRFLNDLRRSTDDIKKSFSDSAGLPRDLNSFEEWSRTRQQNNQIGANSTPAALPEPDHIAGAHDGLDHDKVGHEIEKPQDYTGGEVNIQTQQMNVDTVKVEESDSGRYNPEGTQNSSPVGAKPRGSINNKPDGSDQT